MFPQIHGVLSIPGQAAESNPFLVDMVAAWLDNGDLNDQHGSNDLTAQNGGPDFVAGVFGNVADFEAASSEYASIASNADLVSGADRDWTWAVIAEHATDPTLGNYWGIVSLHPSDGTDHAHYLLRQAYNNKIAFYVSDGTNDSDNIHANTNATGGGYVLAFFWHDSTNNEINTRFYTTIGGGGATGVPEAYSHGGQTTSGTVEVGNSSATTSTHYDGKMAAVWRWNRLLTIAEMDALWNGGILQPYPFTEGLYYRGNANLIAAANVLDKVMHPNTGTLYAGSAVADSNPYTLAFYTDVQSPDGANHCLVSADDNAVGLLVGLGLAGQNGWRDKTGTWHDIGLFTSGAKSYFLVCDGANTQAYRDNVAVGSAVARADGFSTMRYRSRWNSATGWSWTPNIRAAIFNKALDSDERSALHTSISRAFRVS